MLMFATGFIVGCVFAFVVELIHEDEEQYHMFVDFEDAFMPSEEKKKLWNQTVRNAQLKAIDNRECWMCINSYLEPWNNHGHLDHTTYCKFSKECVDFNNGKKCQNWEQRELIQIGE